MASSIYISGKKPIAGWRKVLEMVAKTGTAVSGLTECTHLCVVANDPRPLSAREIKLYRNIVGEAAWQRIQSIYTEGQKLKWKPSYIHRLISWPGKKGPLNQLQLIQRKASRQPGSKTLSAAVFSPTDLTRFISASVPCLLSIDFKIRNGSVSLAAFFRSQDVFRFFLGDYHYLSIILSELVAQVSSGPRKYTSAELICFLCSAHFHNKVRSQVSDLSKT